MVKFPLSAALPFTGISINYAIAAFSRKSASDYSCISLMEHELTSLLMPGLLQIKSPFLLLEFVTGRTGPRKTRAPGPFPRPAPLNGLGRGVFFRIPCPCPRSGPRPTHTPDGFPLEMGGNKRGPVQGMSAGGPGTGADRGLPETYPPGPM